MVRHYTVMCVLFLTGDTFYIYVDISRDPSFHNPFADGAYSSVTVGRYRDTL
jgi:hypothetical protein